MTRFIFVRHGQSTANRDGIFAGHYNAELTELGHSQAKMTADYIYNNYKVDSVYASDLYRAFFTGKYIADAFGIEIIADERLREIYAGAWDGERFAVSRQRYPEEFYVWDNDIGNCRTPDGESLKDVGARAFAAISEIAERNEGKTVVIATHATPIRSLMCIADGGDFDTMKDIPWVSNSSVSVAEFEKGNIIFNVRSYDEHLGKDRTTVKTV